MPQAQKKGSLSSKDKRNNSCNIADVLMTAKAIASENITVKGPPITMEVVRYFTDYLVKHSFIKKILLCGLNAGTMKKVIGRIVMYRLYGRNIFKSKR